MNAKTVALFILFLTFGFITKAEEPDNYYGPKNFSDIPGGIVYSNGKDAIYYEFKTETETNFTSDIRWAVVKYPSAVSESGEFLVWGQDNKFCARTVAKRSSLRSTSRNKNNRYAIRQA